MARRSDHTRQELIELALESARALVVQGGVSALSGRKITQRMGYTVGTRYQLFEDMDDLVEQMNAITLAALFDHCSEGAKIDDIAQQLKAFGIRFAGFVNDHPNEWDAIMSYRFKSGHETSDAYNYEIGRLFGLLETATQSFYSAAEQEDHEADMAVLWASVMGILGVASAERQVGGMTMEQMLDQLIRMYLKARA